MNTKVLILSSQLDWHANSVVKHLHHMDVSVDLFQFYDLLQACTISLRLGFEKVQAVLRPTTGTTIDLREYSAIWHRRPGQIKSPAMPERWMEQFVEQEARSTCDAMLFPLSCIWVNHPQKDALCMNKLLQLERASKIGFRVPKTIVTNSQSLVREFYQECEGKLVYKVIAEVSNQLIPTFQTPGVATSALRDIDLEFLDQVQYGPHLFQERIDKQFDLRVTVVGKRVFCIRIDSQSGRGKTDWRFDYSVSMEPFDLPDDVANRCLELMRLLGLNYGAFDLCLAENNEYVFFEINCAGQYGWIEQRCHLPISLEIGKLLTGASEPLVHPVVL